MISVGKLNPPFIELSFYMGHRDHRLSVASALSTLKEHGAIIDSELMVRDENGHMDKIAFKDLDDLPELSELSSGFACKVQTGIARKSEIIESENTHVLLRSEAGALSVPDPIKSEREATGLNVYQIFKYLSDSLDAAYGAICVEYSLETPSEIRDDPRSLAFRNFWVSNSRIPYATIRKIKSIMKGAYIQDFAHGTYFSTDPAYNPERVGIELDEADKKSVIVARILGKTLIA